MTDLKSQMLVLIALQKAEVDIKKNERDLATTDERVSALNQELSDYQGRVADQEEKLAEFKKQYRSDENEVKMVEGQAIKSKEKLGAVKTNKEYQSMLKEIDELKIKASDMEDRMLINLDEIETSEKVLVELKADLDDVSAEVQEKQAAILKRADLQRKDLASLEKERDEIWEDIQPKLRTVYQNGKRQGSGIAIAEIVDAVCQVCRMNLPPQLYLDLIRMDELRFCPHCQRIMYPRTLVEKG